MAGWAQEMSALLDQGYVPAGTKPKVIPAGGQEAGYYDISPMGQIFRAMTKNKQKTEADFEEKLKATKKKADMYQTLRESGYSPKSAYDAVESAQYPSGVPEETGATKFDKAKLDIDKTQVEIQNLKKKGSTVTKSELQGNIIQKIILGDELTSGEQKIYDETIKGKGDELANLFNNDEGVSTKDKIVNKISAGEDLTEGEQKIYDEVIKKKTTSVNDTSSGKGKKIKVYAPDGTPGSIWESQLETALAQGYKRR